MVSQKNRKVFSEIPSPAQQMPSLGNTPTAVMHPPYPSPVTRVIAQLPFPAPALPLAVPVVGGGQLQGSGRPGGPASVSADVGGGLCVAGCVLSPCPSTPVPPTRCSWHAGRSPLLGDLAMQVPEGPVDWCSPSCFSSSLVYLTWVGSVADFHF